jgi:hypothetical protein
VGLVLTVLRDRCAGFAQLQPASPLIPFRIYPKNLNNRKKAQSTTHDRRFTWPYGPVTGH